MSDEPQHGADVARAEENDGDAVGENHPTPERIAGIAEFIQRDNVAAMTVAVEIGEGECEVKGFDHCPDEAENPEDEMAYVAYLAVQQLDRAGLLSNAPISYQAMQALEQLEAEAAEAEAEAAEAGTSIDVE